jgi:hypothetical protein
VGWEKVDKSQRKQHVVILYRYSHNILCSPCHAQIFYTIRGTVVKGFEEALKKIFLPVPSASHGMAELVVSLPHIHRRRPDSCWKTPLIDQAAVLMVV